MKPDQRAELVEPVQQVQSEKPEQRDLKVELAERVRQEQSE